MKIINLRNVQCSPILNTTSSDQAKKLDKFSVLLEMFQLRVQLVCVSMRKHRAPYRAVVTGFFLHCRGSFGYASMEVVSCIFNLFISLVTTQESRSAVGILDQRGASCCTEPAWYSVRWRSFGQVQLHHVIQVGVFQTYFHLLC